MHYWITHVAVKHALNHRKRKVQTKKIYFKESIKVSIMGNIIILSYFLYSLVFFLSYPFEKGLQILSAFCISKYLPQLFLKIQYLRTKDSLRDGLCVLHCVTGKMTVLKSQYLLLSALSSSQLCGHPFLHFSAVGHDCLKDGQGIGTNWLLLFFTGTCFIVSLQCQEWVV